MLELTNTLQIKILPKSHTHYLSPHLISTSYKQAAYRSLLTLELYALRGPSALPPPGFYRRKFDPTNTSDITSIINPTSFRHHCIMRKGNMDKDRANRIFWVRCMLALIYKSLALTRFRDWWTWRLSIVIRTLKQDFDTTIRIDGHFKVFRRLVFRQNNGSNLQLAVWRADFNLHPL